MPVYEFRCGRCGNGVEMQLPIEHPLPFCFSEVCNGSTEMEQLISKTSFALKGNGWSRDGYTGIPGAGDK